MKYSANIRRFLAITILATSFAPLLPAQAAAAAIPSHMPQTRSLDSELSRLKRECDTSRNLTRQMRDKTKSARKNVEQAIRVTGLVRSLDRRMVKLIDKLKPYLSIPKVRTVAKTLRDNLIRVQKKLGKVRRKTDKIARNTLKPLRKKLVAAEGKLRAAESKIQQVSATAAQSRQQLAQAASVAQHNRHTQAALESASQQTRPATRNITSTIASVNGDVRSVLNEINSVQNSFGGFRKVESPLNKLSKDLKPSEKVAGDIDRVLSKRLEIRLPVPPFKKVGFSIRQILEKPGEVIGAVLKPLEKLVDKALQPILKKAGLQIKPPAGLAELERSVDQLLSKGPRLSTKIDRLNAKLSAELMQQAGQFVSIAKAKLQSANLKAPARTNSQPRRQPVVFFGA